MATGDRSVGDLRNVAEADFLRIVFQRHLVFDLQDLRRRVLLLA